MSVNKKLANLYYDYKKDYGLAGINKMMSAIKRKKWNISKQQLLNFLRSQKAYTLHAPRKIKMKRQKILAFGIEHNLQMDLADMSGLSRTNGGIKFLCVLIDCLSKMIYVLKLKNKKGSTMAEEINEFFKSNFAPALIGSDLGTEFWNREVQNVFKRYNVTLYALREPLKASLAQYGVKRVKERIYKFITYQKDCGIKNPTRYIDDLDDMILGLNRSVNRVTGFAPIDVSYSNQHIVVQNVYGSKLYDYLRKNKNPKLKPGTVVRVSLLRHPFMKTHKGAWSTDTFLVDKVKHGIPDRYSLKNMEKEELIGTYYNEELMEVVLPN